VAPLRGGCAILDSPRQTARYREQRAGLSKRVKAKERAARALTRLVKPMTIETGFCVSGTITKSCHRPALSGWDWCRLMGLYDASPQVRNPASAP
jgi:hypothetical protein